MRAMYFPKAETLMVFGDDQGNDLVAIRDVPEGRGFLDVLSDLGYRRATDDLSPVADDRHVTPSGQVVYRFPVARRLEDVTAAQVVHFAQLDHAYVSALVDFAELMRCSIPDTLSLPEDVRQQAASFLVARGLMVPAVAL